MKPMIPFALLLTAAAPAAGPVNIERNSATLEFSSSWSAEAAAVPALDRRFRAATQKAWVEARATVRAEQKLTREQERPFNQQFYSMDWTTAGQSKRLLSLQSTLGTFTGGAHPNSLYGALLWDRTAGRAVPLSSLFATPSGLMATTRAAYCKALDAERLERREGEKLDGPFNACPAYADLAIAPSDADKDGLFDTLDFVASQYTAGPYVEGVYAITLPVTGAVLKALKPAFRTSFEVQPQ
jgi:hypothetical protein